MSESVPLPPELPGAQSPALIPAASFLWRNRHLTVPAAVPFVFSAAGYSVQLLGAHSALLAADVVGSAAMWLAAPHKWDRKAEQWYARLSVACGGTWLAVSSWTGDSWPMLAALGAGSVAWAAPWWWHKRPRQRRGDARAVAQWDEWWQYHARHWDMPGSRVTEVSVKGPLVTLHVQLWAGRHGSAQVRTVAHLIESALRGYVRPGMVRVEEDPDDASRALVHLKRQNPFARSFEWDETLVPATINEPAPLGVSETGIPIARPLTTNWFIIGQSRAGKSNELSALLATITSVPDARAWLIDRKGGRAARPWMKALDWVATSIDEARLMLETALAEVRGRAANAYDGNEQLTPTAEVPAIFVIVDEAHEVTSMESGDARCAALLASISSMGMGVAVYVVVLTQYGALAESVRTEQTRSNLLARMCFAVAKPEHGAFALNDWAALDASRLKSKGAFYLQDGPQASSVPGRGPDMRHSLVSQIAERNGAMPRRPLVLYVADHQQAYDSRWLRLSPEFRGLAPQYAQSAQTLPEVTMTPPLPDDEASALAAQVEADVAATPDVPLASLSVPDDLALRSELDRRKARFARALTDAPETGITPRQLIDATGLSRSWIHQQLRELVTAGAVTQLGKGSYRASGDVWAAMEIIREANAALLTEARSA